MLKNCTENGYLISCFQKIGILESSTQCEKSCKAKKLNQFGLDDFYNFAERLNDSNYLIMEDSDSEKRASQTCMTRKI